MKTPLDAELETVKTPLDLELFSIFVMNLPDTRVRVKFIYRVYVI